MKRRTIINGILGMVLALSLIALPRQIFANAAAPSIKILKVKTYNSEKKPQTEFDLWQPVLFRIKYEITGDEDTRYKVKGIVRIFGEEIVVRQKRSPGVRRMVTGLLVPGRAVPGEKTVRYKVKLIEGGGVLDAATATSQITIPTPNPNLGYLRLVQKDPGDWSVVKGGARGLLRYTRTGPLFIFRLHARGLSPNTSYTLIYYPDPWPGDGLVCLARGTADYHGYLRHVVGAAKIKGGLPAEFDENYPGGAKIWLVRSDDVDCAGKMMVDWNPGEYLFEYNLITYEDAKDNYEINAVVRINPRTLNIESKGKWMTCRIGLTGGYSIKNIDVNTVLLEGSIPASGSRVRGTALVVKFDRDAVQDLIEGMGLKYPANVELKVTGQLYDGTRFEGSNTIKVIKGARSKKGKKR